METELERRVAELERKLRGEEVTWLEQRVAQLESEKAAWAVERVALVESAKKAQQLLSQFRERYLIDS